MQALLKLALGVDWISERIARIAAVAVLVVALISSGNAFVRYLFGIGSNSWLEIQWYLFAGIVMLGAPYVLCVNEHVRVDLIYGRLKGNWPVYVDLFGLFLFLLPVMCLMLYLTWPLLVQMYVSQERSSNAGGLIRWPAMAMLPLGFALMIAQGLSEIVKRIAYLRGEFAMDTHYEAPVQ
jgi:TRAP-type mannitol/chloroaromatic compound transport system permease small subunit